MTERFGIQDHGPQITQHALQNPTNPGHFDNIGAGDNHFPTPNYAPGAFAHPDLMDRILARKKSMIAAVLLALIFGPWGIFYTSRKAALLILGLTFLAGIAEVGSIRALGSEMVMGPIWNVARVVAVAWNIYAMRLYQRAQAEKEQTPLS